MNTSASTSVDFEGVHRQLIQLGYADQEIYEVVRGENLHLPRQHRSTKQQEVRARAAIDDGWRTLDPWKTTNFSDINKQLPYRQNLVLMENGTPILQRMGFFSYNNLRHQRAAEAKGCNLLQAVEQLAHHHNAAEDNTRSQHPVFHFGIWTDRTHNTPIITRDTRQESGTRRRVDEPAAAAVMEFILWTRDYVENYIYPLVKSNKYNIARPIKAAFQQHKEDYKWLLDQEIATAARHICHPMYSTMSPFSGFSTQMHSDQQDTGYSFLINFGAKCLLSLGEFKIKIDLQPFDVVFFNTKLLHKTEEKVGDPASGLRWAISGYMRQKFEEQASSTDCTAFGAVAARAVRMRQALD